MGITCSRACHDCWRLQCLQNINNTCTHKLARQHTHQYDACAVARQYMHAVRTQYARGTHTVRTLPDDLMPLMRAPKMTNPARRRQSTSCQRSSPPPSSTLPDMPSTSTLTTDTNVDVHVHVHVPGKHKDGLRWYKTVLSHLIPSKR